MMLISCDKTRNEVDFPLWLLDIVLEPMTAVEEDVALLRPLMLLDFDWNMQVTKFGGSAMQVEK